MRYLLIILFSFLFIACSSNANDSSIIKLDRDLEDNNVIQESKIKQENGLATAYFASGCFWCVEAVYQSVEGVVDAISGYAGGEKVNPTYQEVSRGETDHAEAVKVMYDPQKVDFKTLVVVFFGSHDPTTLNRQGPDRGAQYRSIAFYNNEKEKSIIEDYINELKEEKVYSSPIVTEIEKIDKFYDAEDYHQEYESNHPENPYVQSVSIPRLRAFQNKFPELLKESEKH